MLPILFLLSFQTSFSQAIFQTRSGNVKFESRAPEENIEATNDAVVSLMNIDNGDVFVKIPIQKFRFENSFMQEHFNEKYLESDKFPFATFKGKILIPDSVTLTSPGQYRLTVHGDLTVHGVVQKRTVECMVVCTEKSIQVTGNFSIALVDHKIEVPQLLFKKVAEKVLVTLTIFHYAKK